jgi:hypothetical protein
MLYVMTGGVHATLSAGQQSICPLHEPLEGEGGDAAGGAEVAVFGAVVGTTVGEWGWANVGDPAGPFDTVSETTELGRTDTPALGDSTTTVPTGAFSAPVRVSVRSPTASKEVTACV